MDSSTGFLKKHPMVLLGTSLGLLMRSPYAKHTGRPTETFTPKRGVNFFENELHGQGRY